jgi:hypothetical protein
VLEVYDTTKSGVAAREAEGDGWRSKMTKVNWVGGLNAQLGRPSDWADKRNMAERMRCIKMIGEVILTDQDGKEKRK